MIPIRNTEAIKNAILELYENPDLRLRMGQIAREKALDFTWDSSGHKLIAAYKFMLSKSKN